METDGEGGREIIIIAQWYFFSCQQVECKYLRRSKITFYDIMACSCFPISFMHMIIVKSIYVNSSNPNPVKGSPALWSVNYFTRHGLKLQFLNPTRSRVTLKLSLAPDGQVSNTNLITQHLRKAWSEIRKAGISLSLMTLRLKTSHRH